MTDNKLVFEKTACLKCGDIHDVAEPHGFTCNHHRWALDCNHEWQIIKLISRQGRTVFFVETVCTKCFGHKVIESKNLDHEN